MKKFIFLIFGCSLVLISYAQTDTTTQKLEEILIQENRIQLPFAKQSRNLSLVDRQQIETSPARSLQEILTFVPGVDVRQRGVGGVQADIGIRGGSFEQTLMLLNGIKLSDPQTGHHMMNIPVPLMQVDRIEILKGPASRIFGQNAYAGAVNVITRLSDLRSLTIQGYAGDFGMKGIHLSGSVPIGDFKQNLAFSHDDSDGHWYNSDYRVTNLFYEGGVALNAKHSIRGMLAYTDRTFGANGFYTSTFPDQWESIQTTLASLSHDFKTNNFTLNTRGYWRQNVDEFRLKRFEPTFFQNNHVTDVFALEVNGAWENKLGTSGFGLETRKESIESSNLGTRARNLSGIFIEHLLYLGEKIDLRAGVYSNYYSEYGWKHFPGSEIGFQATENLRIYSGYGVSYRIPTYTDLFYRGPTNIGNDQLIPEQAENIELGTKWNKNGFWAEMVFFIRQTDNLIEWTRTNNKSPWQPQNFTEVSFRGLETALHYRGSQKKGKFTFKEFMLSHNFIHTNLVKSQESETRYALTALRNQIIGGFLAGIGPKIEWNTKLRWIERENQAAYFLVDMRVDYNRLGKIGFFVETTNLTSEEYVEAGTVQMPGRWFRGGFIVNLYGK